MPFAVSFWHKDRWIYIISQSKAWKSFILYLQLYPNIPMKVLRGFKRPVSLAERGMMMGLGKRSSDPREDFETISSL